MYDLTKKLLDGDTSEVPVGVNVLTNKPDQNSPNVKRITTGTPLQNLQLGYFEAEGYEATQVERDPENNELTFETPQDPNILRSVDWAFDNDAGILTFVRRNKESVQIPSFLRQSDFGSGPQGPRGNPGLMGRNGKDGDDGRDGIPGCAGEEGNDGRQGVEGARGAEGPVGPTGPAGPRGIRGERGEQGPEGIIGFEGLRGPCGFSCPANLVGPDGPQGLTLDGRICTGAKPAKTCLIWATPDDCLCPLDPHDVAYVDIPKPTLVAERIMQAPPLICTGGQTIYGVWLGPTTANGTYIERIYSDGSIVTTAPDYGGAVCAMPVQPPPVLKCVYEPNFTYVYKTRRRKKNDNYPWFYFYKNGILLHRVQIGAKNGNYTFTQGSAISVGGRRYWQGAHTRSYYDSSYHDFYELCGEFEQDE